MSSRAAVLGVLLVLAARPAAALSVKAVVDPPRVVVGESADLAVEIEGAQAVAPPELGSIAGLTVSYRGPSTQVSIVNGQATTSVTHHFSVAGAKPGSFTIGPISVTHEGKRYDAGTVTLQVLPGGAAAGEQAAPDQLNLTFAVPKTEIFVGERIPLTLTLRIGSVRVADLQYPVIAGDGFALDKLPEPTQRSERTASGVFQVVEFRTTLSALRSGPLTVGPATMKMSQLVRGRRNDPFFGQLFGDTRRPVELLSAPLNLTGLPIPEADRPASFSGAVGRFTFEVTAAPLELAAGDPVTVTTTIRGEGNLESVTPPAISGSDALRVYPLTAAGRPADTPQPRVYEQVVIPQREGPMTLPTLEFTYFDPDARAFQTITQSGIALTVQPPAHVRSAPEITGIAPPGRPESLGRDIVFIKDTPGTFRAIGDRRYRSAGFWALQLLPLAAWLAVVVYDRRRRRLSGDLRFARFTRAGRTARQAIAIAHDALRAGDRPVFYDTVARAISDYLSAKLDLPPGSVSAHTVGERLQGSGLSPEVSRDLAEFFETCERARFAPAGDAGADMQRTFAAAKAIVRRLERERRLARPLAAALLLALAGVAWAAGGESPNIIFFRAGALYAEERHAEALAEYERVRAAGWESGNLYFNLGNAYFKTGDLGRAVLNYERARELIPRDPDLGANLAHAHTLTGEAAETPLYARFLFPLAERASSDELLLGASLAYVVLILLLILARLAPAAERAASGVALGAAVVLAVLLSSAAYRLVTLELPTRAVVVAAEEATVRFEPSASGTVHFSAKPGSVFRVLAERGAWRQVTRQDGRRGWIEQAALETL